MVNDDKESNEKTLVKNGSVKEVSCCVVVGE